MAELNERQIDAEIKKLRKKAADLRKARAAEAEKADAKKKAEGKAASDALYGLVEEGFRALAKEVKALKAAADAAGAMGVDEVEVALSRASRALSSARPVLKLTDAEKALLPAAPAVAKKAAKRGK